MNTLDFGALHIRTALALVIMSVVLCGLLYTGYINGSYWVALIPAIYAWARPSLYRLICDATYHAHHRFEEDMLTEEAVAQKSRMDDAVTLDASKFLRSLAADDETAGRA